jgi:pimeloyl-ACP methyl ester carboxylesterase
MAIYKQIQMRSFWQFFYVKINTKILVAVQQLKLFLWKLPGAFDQIPPDGRNELMRFAHTMSLEMLTDPDIYFTYVDEFQLKKINVPVLLVSGDKSPVFFHMITNFLAKSLPDNQQITIKNASHSMYRDNSKEFNEKVLAFLAMHS